MDELNEKFEEIETKFAVDDSRKVAEQRNKKLNEKLDRIGQITYNKEKAAEQRNKKLNEKLEEIETKFAVVTQDMVEKICTEIAKSTSATAAVEKGNDA